MKRFIRLFLLFLTGCATQIPQPAPIPCEVKVKGECRAMTPAERTGPVVRGHSDDPKETP